MTKLIVTGGERIVAGASRSPGHNTLRDEAWNRIAKTEYLPEAPTINLAVHRSVFDRIGDFDERFAYGSDVDFTWRAVDAGFRINTSRPQLSLMTGEPGVRSCGGRGTTDGPARVCTSSTAIAGMT